MNRSHIHQFSYNNINKSSPLTYLGHNFYLYFCLWEIYPFCMGDSFARKTVAIWNKYLGRRFTTTSRILQGFTFLCKLGLLLFKPRRDFQI